MYAGVQSPQKQITPLAAMLCAAACVIPLAATLALRGSPDGLMAVWLLALVPIFVLAYDRGAGGAALGTAAGLLALLVAAGSVRALGAGGQVWPLLGEAAVVLLASGLAVGWLAERFHQEWRLNYRTGLELACVVDEEGRIRFASPGLQRIVGYAPNELLGRELNAFIHADDTVWLQRIARMGTRALVPPVDLRFQHKDSSWRVLDTAAQNLIGDPAVGGIVLHLRDVTERRQLEERVGRAQRMEAMGKLAAGLADEFNNLLTTIKGHAHLILAERESDELVLRGLTEIDDASDRAARLTRQLLAFTRQQVLQPKVLNVNTVVSDLEPMLRRLAGDLVEVVVAPDGRLGRIKADPSQLEEVILHLAMNAREAMPDGGRLTVRTLNVMIDEVFAVRFSYPVLTGPYVLLTISDTGPGMDTDTRTRVFEPFFTGRPGRKTGMGLSMVYGVVKQSGGYIWIDSEPGQGTLVSIYLPRVEGEAVQLTLPRTKRARGSERVLLVEDDERVRALVARVLERDGYCVLEAANGREALRRAHAGPGPIDLLLTDIALPEIDGMTLAEQLLQRDPRLRVLLTSGYTAEAVLRPEVFGPETAFLQKPFAPDQLAERVREILDAPAAASNLVEESALVATA